MFRRVVSLHVRIVLRAAFASLLIAATPVPAEEVEPPRFEPDLEAEGRPELEGTTWIARGDTWAGWLRPVDDSERLNFIERVTGLRVDPFADAPDRPERYVTWLLVLRNDGDDAIQFNPTGCWLTPNRDQELQSPVGFDGLSFDYRVAGGELPPAYAGIRPAVFEWPLRIPPGETVSGLLVYRRLGPKIRRFRIDVPLTLPNGHGASFTAHYRMVKPEKKKKRKGRS